MGGGHIDLGLRRFKVRVLFTRFEFIGFNTKVLCMISEHACNV